MKHGEMPSLQTFKVPLSQLSHGKDELLCENRSRYSIAIEFCKNMDQNTTCVTLEQKYCNTCSNNRKSYCNNSNTASFTTPEICRTILHLTFPISRSRYYICYHLATLTLERIQLFWYNTDKHISMAHTYTLCSKKYSRHRKHHKVASTVRHQCTTCLE